jgi:xylulokinase
MQIIADVLSAELVTVNTTEGAAYGAALLAGVGAGVFEDVSSACEQNVHVTGGASPGRDLEAYRDYYPRYQALYPALSGEFSSIAAVVDKHLGKGKSG